MPAPSVFCFFLTEFFFVAVNNACAQKPRRPYLDAPKPKCKLKNGRVCGELVGAAGQLG